MPVQCRVAEVIECSVNGGGEEEGDAFLAVVLCSPATTRAEKVTWDAAAELRPLTKVSVTKYSADKGKKQDFFFLHSFLLL